MWVYIHKPFESKYTVGFFDPLGVWHGDSSHDTAVIAAQLVHYLNGGDLKE